MAAVAQARMLYNAPLHRTEQWLRELVKQHWITLHWVVLWVALSAIRMEYVAAGRESSFQTNLVATSIYYLLWGVLAVKHASLHSMFEAKYIIPTGLMHVLNLAHVSSNSYSAYYTHFSKLRCYIG